MKTVNGRPYHLTVPIVGRVSRKQILFGRKSDILLIRQNAECLPAGYAAIITSACMDGQPSRIPIPVVGGVGAEDLEVLHDGDVLIVEPNGRVLRLWDSSSASNVVFVTNACNCQCIMCPQPRESDADTLHWQNMRMLELVPQSFKGTIGITGGEPTLKPEALCEILARCKVRLPAASLDLLTNGRAFQNFELVKRVAIVQHPSLTHCVALQSDVDTIHDQIMGVTGGFAETITGLYHLARLRQRVEIRLVLVRQNTDRLAQFAEFIYRNLPFVQHIALMGMETTGVALKHLDKVWIDPVEYMSELREAVQHLHQRNLRVSLYNLPLCLLPEELWRFAHDSISDWKKTYLTQCAGCRVQSRCPGVFATSGKHSDHITPVE